MRTATSVASAWDVRTPIQDDPRHPGALLGMPDEVAIRLGRGLADVVEQGSQDQPFGRLGKAGRGVRGGHAVVEQVVARDLVLRDAVLCGELRQHHGQDADVVQDPQAIRRSSLGDDASQLGADPFA